MQDLKQALEALSLEQSIAEFHGMLTGFLACQNNDEQWLIDLIGQQDASNLLAKDAVLYLIQLVDNTRQNLNSDNFNFNIILSDDLSPITQRLQELSQWCDSFLYAFGLSNIKVIANSEMAEILQDFSDFSRADTINITTSDNENELALMEIIEYVKVGVLLIFTETKNNLSDNYIE